MRELVAGIGGSTRQGSRRPCRRHALRPWRCNPAAGYPSSHATMLHPKCCSPVLRLVCKCFKSLVDGVLATQFKIGGASHLGGRLSSICIYSSQLEFTAAAARVMKQRAGGRSSCRKGGLKHKPVVLLEERRNEAPAASSCPALLAACAGWTWISMPTAAALPASCWRSSACRSCTRWRFRTWRRSMWRCSGRCPGCATSASAGSSTDQARAVAHPVGCLIMPPCSLCSEK